MRVFWILVGIAVLAGVAFLAFDFRSAPVGPALNETASALATFTAPAPEGDPAIPRAIPAAVPPTTPPTQPVTTVAPDGSPSALAQPVTSPPVTPPAAPSEDKNTPNSPSPLPSASFVGPKAPTNDAPIKAADTGAKAPARDANAPDAKGAPSAAADGVVKVGGYEVAPGVIEKKEDGSIIIDGKYPVKGDGSKDNPYEVTWDLLTSADQEFDPHANKKKLPQRIAMLHDKYVKLGGWIAFPMNMQQPKELLLMLNQWDGCCIGVPPTPYDAIEVSLNKVVAGEDRFTSTGSVTGKFSVKPYVVGDWLVGLYVMDQSDMKPRFGGGAN